MSPELCIVPYHRYELPYRQYLTERKMPTFFTVRRQPGAPLRPSFPRGYHNIDDSQTPIFEGCGTKITYVVQIAGYKPFKQQKYAHTGGHGAKVPCNRAKVVRQVAEVMEAFIHSKKHEICTGPLQLGRGGIQLEDLFLVELRHVSKSSFQPILAIKSTLAPPALMGRTLHPSSEVVDNNGAISQGNRNLEGDDTVQVVGENLDLWHSEFALALMRA